MSDATRRTGRRWGVVVAASVVLLLGVAGELVALPVPLHVLALVLMVAALAVLSRVMPDLVAGDPTAGSGGGRGM